MNERPPTIDSSEKYEDYHQKCVNEYLPGLLVTTIPYRKYARVEFDFVLVDGWRLLVRDDGSHRKLSATLSVDAVEEAEENLSRYEDKEAPSASSHSWRIGTNAGFYTTPKMEVKAAEELAQELAPVVNNRANWNIHPKSVDAEDDKIVIPDDLRAQ